MFFTILIVFFSLIGLIVLHEFGHFVLAKKFGVRVEEFGIGYPPRLFAKKFGETLYSINLLPFGAFVKIPGEIEKIDDQRSFSAQPIGKRILIVLGGVISFWIISAVLLSIVMALGTAMVISDEENGELRNPRVQVVQVIPGSPAEIAGIRSGDTIRKFSILNFQFSINKVKEVQELTEKYKGEEVFLTIERGKKVFDVSLIPRVSPPKGQGPMGLTLVRTAEKSYPWFLSPIKGIEATFKLSGLVFRGFGQILGNLIRGKGLPAGAQLVGPIGIGTLMTQAVQLGLAYYLQFVGLISIYLAIFNLLPIPAVDGGKILFLLIEAIRKKPISQKLEQKITAAFFSLLIVLMIWITIKDIARIF